MKEQVAQLQDSLKDLKEGDRRFATSLIDTFNKKGQLSPRQAPWVATLIERAETNANPPAPTQVSVGSMEGLIELFKMAAQHLKYPKINLQLDNGKPVVLKLAGPRAKTPGSIYVTNGGHYGSAGNRWYGRVSPDGTWEQGHSVEELAEVGALLGRMSSSPAETAAEYGKLTGNCCFCCRPLKDERSTSVGYGPVCAENYHLPWGALLPI